MIKKILIPSKKTEKQIIVIYGHTAHFNSQQIKMNNRISSNDISCNNDYVFLVLQIHYTHLSLNKIIDWFLVLFSGTAAFVW